MDSQGRIGITADWGGGLVASADGMRFVVPARSLHSRPSPLYFGVGKRPRGATWLNTVSDIARYWDDVLRVAGSLATGQVRAYDLIKMMTAGGRTTGLGSAFASYGRIFKTLHPLQLIHVEEYRRMIGSQLNTGESRHFLGRRVFFGNLGRLMRGCERGMENQLGALGLGLNAITWWNSLYTDAAVKKPEAGGLGVSPEIRARLSPLVGRRSRSRSASPAPTAWSTCAPMSWTCSGSTGGRPTSN